MRKTQLLNSKTSAKNANLKELRNVEKQTNLRQSQTRNFQQKSKHDNL